METHSGIMPTLLVVTESCFRRLVGLVSFLTTGVSQIVSMFW